MIVRRLACVPVLSQGCPTRLASHRRLSATVLVGTIGHLRVLIVFVACRRLLMMVGVATDVVAVTFLVPSAPSLGIAARVTRPAFGHLCLLLDF